MKNPIPAVVFALAILITPPATAEDFAAALTAGNSPFSFYGEFVTYVPEDANETHCVNPNASVACAKVTSGFGFRAGASYKFPDFPVSAEASFLLASGDTYAGYGRDSLLDRGDWEYTAKMLGVRFSPDVGEDVRFSLGGGVNFADVSFDEFAVDDDDFTEPYWTVSASWRFLHASWWHSDGDNAFGYGVTIRP